MRQSAIVLLLACGLAACSASLADCSTGDARIVIAQWGNVVGRDADSNIKLTGGRAIFKVLFERAPAAKSLFMRLNVDDFEGPEFSGHIMRVMSGLDTLLNYLLDRPTLESMLAHLAEQHVARIGVTTAAFDLMGEVLLRGLPVVIDDFNADAWANCLIPILEGMSAGLP